MSAVANSAPTAPQVFDSVRLERIFADCFAQSHHTRLVGGAGEPLYRPGRDGGGHTLYYRADYFASALHEVAHWCIAGRERRRRVDFGYWYEPEGRNPAQQRAFEAVECKPQALEWLFSRAAGWTFRLSVDNLDDERGAVPDLNAFAGCVLERARGWQHSGLPRRAARFYDALCLEFGTGVTPRAQSLQLADLLR